MKTKKLRCLAGNLSLALLVIPMLACGQKPDEGFLEKRFDETFVKDTSALIKIQTFRADASKESDELVQKNVNKIRDYLNERIKTINSELEKNGDLKIIPFEWNEKPTEGETPGRVVGYRVGTGKKKFSIMTHLDTVPAKGDAFDPKIEEKTYGDSKQKFLTGRGSIDDKGPSIIALTILEAAAMKFNGTSGLDDWTIEATFDTAEETASAIEAYTNAVGTPDLGIVYDAFWCVRAEKGIERPVFSIPVGKTPTKGMWISNFASEDGPANQIAGFATAKIEGDGVADLQKKIESRYKSAIFDDKDYRKAPFNAEMKEGALILKTTVEGAQHGSAPDANRKEGANPVVSLANFLADLAKDGTLDHSNGYAQMAEFITWGWGTKVFGEHHPEQLMRSDDIFKEGNGTTWALTRVLTDEKGVINLLTDVRYAQGHQSVQWDGKTDGVLKGTSIFPDVLKALAQKFDTLQPDAKLTFTTKNYYAPDIRNPDGPAFKKMDAAFQKVLGKDCPRFAIGGGTDAKGNPNLIAAGALFRTEFGAPINYHGLNEAAPIKDLRQSAQVLYEVLLDTIK